MKKFVRFVYNSKVHYGLYNGIEVTLIEGDIFDCYELTDKRIPLNVVSLLAPLEPTQIIGIGLNYYDHALEAGMDIPKEPVIFMKGINSIIGVNEDIILPDPYSCEVDYEGELIIVIGKRARNISDDEALNFVFGYTCGNDITARDIQLKIDKQWSRSKSFDTFCPIGPYITTDINPSDLEIVTRLNNNVVQKSRTSKMIFNCNKIVSYLSKQMTLLPKTVIMTGTPSGVGYFKSPKLFLRRNDIIEIEIEKIGKLKNHVV